KITAQAQSYPQEHLQMRYRQLLKQLALLMLAANDYSLVDFDCNSVSAASTSSLCLFGFTPVNAFTTVPEGSITNVFLAAYFCPFRSIIELYLVAISSEESESNLKLSPSFAQKLLCESTESRLTPKITAFFFSY